MKPRTTKETAIICVAVVVAIALLAIPFEVSTRTADGATTNNSGYLFWIVVAGVAALWITLSYRYLSEKKKAQIELTGSEQYRKLADEYRRMADMMITSQEHIDLRLGEFSAQLEFLREQNESLHRILKDVE
jgi:hypothetical protein